jgi:hypothetical protein
MMHSHQIQPSACGARPPLLAESGSPCTSWAERAAGYKYGALSQISLGLCGIVSSVAGSCWRLGKLGTPPVWSFAGIGRFFLPCLPLNVVFTQLYLIPSPRQQLFAYSIYHISNGAQLQCLSFENSRIATPVFIRMESVVGVLSVDGLAIPPHTGQCHRGGSSLQHTLMPRVTRLEKCCIAGNGKQSCFPAEVKDSSGLTHVSFFPIRSWRIFCCDPAIETLSESRDKVARMKEKNHLLQLVYELSLACILFIVKH